MRVNLKTNNKFKLFINKCGIFKMIDQVIIFSRIVFTYFAERIRRLPLNSFNFYMIRKNT